MLRSNSRSNSSRFTRAISASKLCRGDVLGCQIDSNALVSLDRKPSKKDNSFERKVNKILELQEQMGHVEEELRETKEQLNFVEGEKNRAIHELKEMKMKLNEGLSAKEAKELFAELEAFKELHSKTQGELKLKDKNIESLKVELEKAKRYEVNVKESEVQAREQLSVFKKKVEELEGELEKKKLSEAKIFDSYESQTRQFEQTKVELEDAMLEIASLRGKVESLEASPKRNGLSNGQITNSVKKEMERLHSEVALAKEDVANAQEREKIALAKAKNSNDEIILLRNEVKSASEAEEKSRKAMDDLALALKEVATEASEAKEKLGATRLELEQVKEEAGKLKEMVRNTEAGYQKLLEEAKKEADLHRNTADRLRLETEESLLAWNGKEIGFITCIKQAEEERSLAHREVERLSESLKAAEDTARAASEEKFKLRDILKQAINEANAAKAAAGLARDENSQLQDRLAEKEEALHFVAKENERLKVRSRDENANESKRVEFRIGTDEGSDHKVKKAFSTDLGQLKFAKKNEDEDPEKAIPDPLKGSIFDPTSVTPKSEPRTPLAHRRRASSPALAAADDKGKPNTENLGYNPSDDSDSDRSTSSRRRALFRKVGDIIMRRSFQV